MTLCPVAVVNLAVNAYVVELVLDEEEPLHPEKAATATKKSMHATNRLR